MRATTLTPAMRAMLRSLRDYGDHEHHLRGRSEFGGAFKTLRALVRRGLVTDVFAPKITEAGREAIAKKQAPK